MKTRFMETRFMETRSMETKLMGTIFMKARFKGFGINENKMQGSKIEDFGKRLKSLTSGAQYAGKDGRDPVA